MNARRHSLLVLGSTAVLVASAWALAWWLQPLYGDLTRIGTHAERYFGPNAPLAEFHPTAASWGSYDRPADVLVIGDSFANLRPAQQWQNWLAVRTGWRIHTVDRLNLPLAALMASPVYALAPPRVVIWNNIERDLRDEYGDGAGHCPARARAAPVDPLVIHPTSRAAARVQRPRPLAQINPGFARAWIWKALAREAFGRDTSQTVRLPLARADLFSARRSSDLLVYRRDLRKSSWKNADLERIRCSYERLAARFEANGRTRFVTAIAPDKSSAYRPWLKDPVALPPSVLPALLENFPVPDARLDRAVSKAVAAGVPDVYLPDDTHWGPAGHRLAAEAILALLVARGLAR
ncbi:MAG: hypothetical protein CO164_01795 [Rhodocyclales bacterium CG_4_9_14_3_um_filter_68_10]|nr:MAG: hypothetical protein CO164_01795 [Rhodocyclales bacterium CG_4_9_14_3_um_filter_68_10]